MSQLVSSVELKKADGKPITFNFQFENGLPVKPIINAVYKKGIHNKESIPIFIIYLQKNQEHIYKEESVKDIFYEHGNDVNNLWISFNSFYINLQKVDRLEYNKFYLGVLDSKDNYLKQVLLNAN